MTITHLRDTPAGRGGLAAFTARVRADAARVGVDIPAPLEPDGPLPVRAVAEVNHGRWIARCPFCLGAEMVDLQEPRFYCLSCYNAAAGHRWLEVVMPPEADAIAAELSRRPQMGTRNWQAGETVARLVAERAAYGGNGEGA